MLGEFASQNGLDDQYFKQFWSEFLTYLRFFPRFVVKVRAILRSARFSFAK